MTLRPVPPIHRQRYEIKAWCDSFAYTFELFQLPDERWYWAVVHDEGDLEPVLLGKDDGYASRAEAIHDAWCHMWPGRQVRYAS